ncbi:MAG: hypothetical protein DSO07_11560, partial [Thermoproteota archaeon]
MLTQFSLSFISPEGLKFQSFSGYAVRGIFFDLIKSVDEKMAENLHSSKDIAPYSVTPVEFVESGRIVYRECGPMKGRFKITVMKDEISEILRDAI